MMKVAVDYVFRKGFIMITSEQVKKWGKEYGADLVGIASMDRFEGAPEQTDPRFIFPEAKSMTVLGFRIPRGTLRGIEEGTYFLGYSAMGYAGINIVYAPTVMWHLMAKIEDAGYECVPIPDANSGDGINPVTGNFRVGYSKSVDGIKPHPDVMPSFRFAAFLAGLGEIGYSKVFLTPEFGPRVRFTLLMTTAELEPDPIYSGPKICDRCKLCARNCTGHAISMTETVKVNLWGHEVEYAKLDVHACEKGLKGGEHGERNPFNAQYDYQYGYGRAIEGAAGCIRACMVHLEARDKLKNKFDRPFRTKKPWTLDRPDVDAIVPAAQREYVDKGLVEDYMDYINYNNYENYGTPDNPRNGCGTL